MDVYLAAVKGKQLIVFVLSRLIKLYKLHTLRYITLLTVYEFSFNLKEGF